MTLSTIGKAQEMKKFFALVMLILACSTNGQNYDDYEDYYGGGDGSYDSSQYGGAGNYYGGNQYGGGGGNQYADGGNYYGGGQYNGYYGGNYGNYYGGNYDYGNGSNYYGNYNYGNGSNYYGNYNYGNGSNYYGNYNYGNGSNYYGNYNYGNGSYYYGNYNYGNGSYGGNYADYYGNQASDPGARDAVPGRFTDCGGELTELPWAVIKTPGYPTEADPQSVYPNNAYCKWWYNGDDKTLVRFKIWDLVVEIGEGGSNVTCDFDYMNVTITSEGSKRFCGYVTPTEEFTGMGSLTVIFVSDGDVGYRGIQATYQITEGHDPCDPSPCSVNGDCEVMSDYLRIRCNCHAGFRGQRCEIDIPECASNPCRNGGTCDDKKAPNLYMCICPKGFEGLNCETRIPNPCWNDPCLNGGTCNKITDSTYSCTCGDNHKGANCEISNFPPCYSSPCKNGGECKDIVDGEDDESGDEGSSKGEDDENKTPKVYEGYECNCTRKFKGRNCDQETGCLNPGIPDLEDDYKFATDATVEFSCADGYILTGVANITCFLDGTWSHSMPDCAAGPEVEAMRQKGPVTPWSGAMMALGGAFLVNVVAFTYWMIAKGPWKKVDRVINISQASLKSRDEVDDESSYDDSSSNSGQSYSGTSSSSRDIP